MDRRVYLAAASGVVTGALAGCTGGDDPGDGDDETPSDTDDEEPAFGDATIRQLSGSGDDSGSAVELEDGLVLVDYSHDGTGRFNVTFDGPDETIYLGGPRGEGRLAGAATAGDYEYQVSADGDWSVDVGVPSAEPGDPLPLEESGTGADVLGPYEFDGSHSVSMETTLDATGPLTNVTIYTRSGESERIVSERHSFEVEQPFRFHGLGWVEIRSPTDDPQPGEWTIALE